MHFVLALNGTESSDADPNDIILPSKDTKLFVPVVTLSSKDNQKLSKLLTNGLKDQCIERNIKQKVKWKIPQMGIDIFSNHIL